MTVLSNSNICSVKQSRRRGIALRDLLLVGMLFTLVLDYRRAEGDAGSLVVVMGLANVLCSAALIQIEQTHLKRVLLLLATFPIFAVTSSIVGIIRGQEPFAAFAQALPILIFAQTALACASYPRNADELNKLLKLVVISGLIAAVWKLFFAITYYDLTLSNARFQVLSGATVLLFSYAIACLLVERQKFMWPSLVMSLGVVFISVTRTYILIFAVIGLASITTLPANKIYRILPKILTLPLALIVCLAIFQMMLPDLADRWTQRLFHYQEVGADITALSRVAEAKGQIQNMKNDVSGLLFGFGIIAPSNWSGEEVDILSSIMGSNGNSHGTSYGHNFYVGAIYVGGILFGLPILAVLIGANLSAFFKIKKTYNTLPSIEKLTAICSVCSAAGYAAFGLLGGTFGDRSMSLYYGIAMGLLLRFIAMPRPTFIACAASSPRSKQIPKPRSHLI